jgi:peroxiredoxin
MANEIRALQEAGIANAALQKGQKAPEFKLKGSGDGRDRGTFVDSKQLLKRGPLIVTFYHGNWSSGCMITLQAMQKHLGLFEAKGATVVAICPQTGDAAAARTASKSGAKFPLLRDDGNLAARQFRLRYQMDAELPGNPEPWPLPMPATYIIDTDSTIVYAFVDCDHTKRAEPADILEALPTRKMEYPKQRGPFSLKIRGWLPIKRSKPAAQ